MAFVYIIYSASLNKFYIGFTTNTVAKRLDKHNSAFYGTNKFTASASDWKIFFFIECEDVDQARKVESHIKKMKSRTYIQNIKKYPDISEKLLAKYISKS